MVDQNKIKFHPVARTLSAASQPHFRPNRRKQAYPGDDPGTDNGLRA